MGKDNTQYTSINPELTGITVTDKVNTNQENIDPTLLTILNKFLLSFESNVKKSTESADLFLKRKLDELDVEAFKNLYRVLKQTDKVILEAKQEQVKHLTTPISEELALYNTIYKRDLNKDGSLGNFTNFGVAAKATVAEAKLIATEKENEEYVLLLAKALSAYDEDDEDKIKEENEKLRESIVGIIKSNGYSEEEANTFWYDVLQENSNDYNNLKEWTTSLIGEKILNDKEWEEFKGANLDDRLGILATHIKSNPYYETITSKFKKEIDRDHEGTLVSNVYSDLLDRFNNNNVSNLNGLKAIPAFIEKLGTGIGIAAMSAPALVDLVTSGIAPSAEKLYSETNEEESDNLVDNLSDTYITKRSLEIYNDMKKLSSEDKQKLVNTYKKVSNENSDIYKLNKNNDLTNISEDDYLKELAKFLVRADVFGELAALNSVSSFWSNTVADKLTILDKVLNTGTMFVNSAVSDLLSLAAVAINPIYLFYNPESGTFDVEGYSDALVQRNALMLYALAIQETGAYTKDLLDKYKALGLNASLIYQTEADLNSVFAASDLWNAVGLYGFTAATTLASMGGSILLKLAIKEGTELMAKAVTKKAMKSLVKSGYHKATAKRLLKDGLEKQFTKAEITAFKEAVTKDVSKKLYRGNLFISGALGTGEGALEATSTYNEFLDLLVGRVKEIRALNILNIKNLSDKELVDAALLLKDADKLIESGALLLVLTPEGTLEYSFVSTDGKAIVQKALMDNLDTVTNLRVERAKDDAADAALFNFTSNSAINGMLKVFLTSSLLSKDASTASKILTKGKKEVKDLITLKNVKGVWQAAVRKDPNFWSRVANSNLGLIVKNTGKTMVGEGLEEYSLNISNVVSLAAMLLDMEDFIKVSLDSESAAAFNSNIYNNFNAALNAFGSLLTDTQALKEGILGALSATIGGLSPSHIGSKLSLKSIHTGSDKTNIINALKNIGSIINSVYDGGIKAAYLENKLNRASTLELVEHVNSWLGNSKNLELISGLLSAMGFLRTINESLEKGDIFSARDNRLNLAIENAIMLRVLLGTDYAYSVNKEVAYTAELLEIALDNNNFNEEGQYTGTNEYVISSLTSFRNSEGNTSRDNIISDRDALTRMGLNALEFLKLLSDVNKAYKKIDTIFKDSDIDPIVKKAFVSTMLLSRKAEERATNLSREREEALNSSNLTEDERQRLRNKSLKSPEELAVLFKYGNLKGALEKLDELLMKLSILSSGLIGKASNSKRAAINSIKNEIKSLKNEIDLYREILGERLLLGSENKEEAEKILLKPADKRDIEISKYEQSLTVEDISSLSPEERSALLLDKKKLTDMSNKAINEYVDLIRRGGLTEDNKESLTAKDIELNLIDEGLLLVKSSEYDRSILSFINNPSFLNDVAVALRTNLRREVIRYLYLDIIDETKTENPIVAIENMIAKTRELNELDKEFDANLLSLEVEKREDVKRVKTNTRDFVDKLLASEKRDTKNLNKVLALVLTISSVTKMSYSDIKKLFDNNDTNTISDLLTKKLTDGSYIFDHYLKVLNPNLIYDLTTLEGLDELLQLSKNFISRTKPTTKVTKLTLPTVDTAHKPEVASTKKLSIPSREDPHLTVITPGDIELNSPLSNYFRKHKTSKHLLDLQTVDDKKNATKLYFMIDSEYSDPNTIFVVKKDKNGNTNVVGAINAEISSTLGLAAATARSLNLGGQVLLKNNASEIGITINLIKDPQYRTNKDKTGPLPIGSIFRELYNDAEYAAKAIKDWAALVVGNLANPILGIVGKDELGKPTLDFLGFRISKTRANPNFPETKGLRDFPIHYEYNGTLYDTTLEDFMFSEFAKNSSAEDILDALRQNEYLSAFLDTWKSFDINNLSGDNRANTAYSLLILPFVFLGWTNSNKDDVISLLETINDDGDHVLVIARKIGTLEITRSFELPSSSNTGINNLERALNFLKNIFTKEPIREGNNTDYVYPFSYYEAQIPYNLITASRTSKNSIQQTANRNLATRLLHGLALADMIEGFIPEAVSRTLTLTNPYFKGTTTKEQTTNSSASTINPKAEVDHTNETVLDKPKKTILDRAKETLSKLPELCRLVVASIIKDSEDNEIRLLDSNSIVYNSKLGSRARVTSLKEFFKGSKAKSFNRDESTAAISSAFGNTIDICIRSIIEFINSKDTTLDYTSLVLEAIKYIKESNGLSKVPNYEDFLIQKFVGSIIEFCLLCKLNGWTIVPNGIIAFGDIPIYKGNTLIGTKLVAGTLDLLVYDNYGYYHIIDIKTLHTNDGKLEKGLVLRKSDWEVLVATYLYLLLLRHPEMKFGLNYILPIGVKYTTPEAGVVPKVDSDNMTITNYKSSGSPITLRLSKVLLGSTIEDFLYLLDGSESSGFEIKLDLDKLDNLEGVIEIQNTDLLMLLRSQKEDDLMQESTSRLGFDYSEEGFDEDESRRSIKELRAIEYFNKYIAPIKRLRLSTTSKAISLILRLVKDKKTILSIIEHEVASILFNGDLNKLLLISGSKALTLLNYSEIVNNAKIYFLNYIKNKLSYINTATRRFLARKATYEYLKGTITLLLLLDILKEYNILFLDIEGLLDVINNPTDTKLKESLLKDLESSKSYTEEYYQNELDEILKTIDDMETKLNFLNLENAISSIANRISSVKLAIYDDSYEVSSSDTKTVESAKSLFSKLGTRSANTVLKTIISNSKDKFTQAVALLLLREISRNGLNIKVTIGESLDLSLEGVTRGKIITVFNNSLDSYDHFERVVLHELIHAVIEKSPEMTEKLKDVFNSALLLYAANIESTIEEVQNSVYGFKNINEFISEFFTNRLFLELLKDILTNKRLSAFDLVVKTTLSIFSKLSSIFKEIENTMESIISTSNILEFQSKKVNKGSTKNRFKSLSKEVLQMLNDRGISSKEYNSWTSEELKFIEECCS